MKSGPGQTTSDVTYGSSHMEFRSVVKQRGTLSTGCLTVSVRTLIAYLSAVCKYYGISFEPLNRLGGGFCLRNETPWYMQGCLRKMQNSFLADFQVL